jgi:hypothetical protein
MSVSSILTSLKSSVGDVLGSGWSELNHVYNLEDNSFRTGDNRFGVGALSGDSVSGTNKAITLDFGFFVVLTNSFVNRSSDANEREALSVIYDQFDSINENVFQKKLNNANILVVQDISYDEPLKVDRGVISVRVNFTVKYRRQTT